MTVKTEHLKKVYFLGIGGIGMSALARYLHAAGARVHGYDKTPTTLTRELEAEGMHIHYDDRPDMIPVDADLIIYTPAVPRELNEYITAQNSGIPMAKRSEFLGAVTNSRNTLAVAGTHGKTTVSTMLAHILYESPAGCTAFLGGISKNHNTNLLLKPDSSFMVAEADEFDRSFLRLHPAGAVITSVDADHLDIYQTHEALLESFSAFAGGIRENGFLVCKKGLPLTPATSAGVKTYTYALRGDADFCTESLKLENGQYTFNLIVPGGRIEGFRPGLPGLFNVENAVAAASVAWLAGVEPDDIQRGIATFSGVKRRFDHRVVKEGLLYIDDYAHHPEELRACIDSVKALYPGRHITGIFQPHLYSRTRDFADGFAESLSLLDRVILLDIYPARELPIPGVSSAMLLEKITVPDRQVAQRDEVIEMMENMDADVILTLGAGDIDQLVEPLTIALNNKNKRP